MSCCICQKSKTTLVCGVCHQDICKNCTVFLEPDQFSFLQSKPEFLESQAFCSACFIEKISPEVAKYEGTLSAAKNILVFDVTQGKETRFIKRKEKEITVKDCTDRDETVLRLAFQAAEKGYNAIVDMDLKSKKVKDGRHQHTLWSGTAVPANVTDSKLMKDRSIWSDPN
jgi:uncharacterized protein YbjQ (UPF0145 family)